MKKFLILLAAFTLICGAASACTAVYVGADASTDGTVMIAKSNDYQDVFPNRVEVVERVEGEPGRSMPVNVAGTVRAPLPATTYRYTSTPFMDSTMAYNGLQRDATVCANECGVSMIMSITAFANKAALAADPLIEDGLTEFTAVDLVTCQSATAREGVGVLCSLLDTYGSSECNIAFIADRKEAWYIEMYTGHQYAAVRLPSDMVCAFGNEYTMDYLSGYAESIVSPGLTQLAADNGFAVYGEGGELNLYATYSGDGMRTDYSHLRTWIGHSILAPSLYGSADPDSFFPLCFRADRKVSLAEVMELIRNRFEGTEYCPDTTGRTDMRVIGTDTALSVHILQIYPELPAEMCTVTWESTAPALYGVFVPVSSASTRISGAYSRNQPAGEIMNADAAAYPWFAFKELNTLCVERDSVEIYGRPVRAYWHEAETRMAEKMASLLQEAAGAAPEKAAELLTDYCCKAQEQAFADAKALLNSVLWTKAKNSNTMKNGRNPETGETLSELKPVPPMEVTLDSSAY